MCLQEIVLHTLYENGTFEIQELERHIKNDIERNGVKMKELLRKLRESYLVKVGESAETRDDEIIFEKDNDNLARSVPQAHYHRVHTADIPYLTVVNSLKRLEKTSLDLGSLDWRASSI